MSEDIRPGQPVGHDYRPEDDFDAAVARGGVRELPYNERPGPGPLPDRIISGRWVDDNPPGTPR